MQFHQGLNHQHSEMDQLRYLLSPSFVTFLVVSAITGSCLCSFMITSGLLLLLFVFHIPKSSEKAAIILDKVSTTHIIAHKGAGKDAPENTIAAIRLAKKNGAQAIEFDVDYTLDGVAVLIHDDTVDRTTDGTGLVNGMTFQDMQKLSASAKHAKQAEFADERVPTLEEGVKTCLQLGLFMYIDIKSQPKRTTEVLLDLYERYPEMYKMAAVCSFQPAIVYQVRKNNPDIVTGLTHRPRVMACEYDGSWRAGNSSGKRPLLALGDIILEWAHFYWLWYLCGTSLFLAGNQHINRWNVKHFSDRGIQTVGWTINEPEEKAFLSKVLHVPYITDTLLPPGGSQ